MKHVTAALFVLVLASSCAIRAPQYFQAGRAKILLDLQKEKDKLKRQTDPVDYTKTQIKISEILLVLVGDSVKTGDMEIMEQRLTEYVTAIQDAHQMMAKTGRDAHKKPNGFRHLEIALRRQVKQLGDIGVALNFDQRDPVEKARDQAAGIRDELLKAIFGGPNGTTPGQL